MAEGDVERPAASALEEELARLKGELETVRRYASEQERRADSAEAQSSITAARAFSAQVAQLGAQEIAAKENLSSIEAQIRTLKQQKATLWSEGKFSEASDLDEQLADAAARRLQLRQAIEYYGNQKNQVSAAPSDAVEQFLAANEGTFSEADKGWIRQNRRYATDAGFRDRVI